MVDASSKKKVTVQVRSFKAHIGGAVDAELTVNWAFGKNGLDTKPMTVSAKQAMAVWNDKFTNSVTLETLTDGTQAPVLGKATLKTNSGDIIGICEVDITRLVDQGSQTFRREIVADD